MIVATWNIRGPQQLPTQAAIVDFVRTHKIDVMGLLETKFKKENYTFFLENNFREWKAVDNFELIGNSRMLLIWNPIKVELEPIRVEEQAIYAKSRCLTSNNSFHFVLVYGLHTIPDRRPLWDSLVEHVMQDEPTFVSGDFNNVLAEDERVGGSVPTEYEIKNMVDTCFNKLVEVNWASNIRGKAQFVLVERGKEFKKHLKEFNVKEFSELSKRAKEAGVKLETLQKQTDRDTTDLALRVQITNQKKKTAYIENSEWEYYKQKAKFKHLLLSDRSTSFFHSLVNRNNSRNYIAFLYRRDSTITGEQEEIISEFMEFYSTLLEPRRSRIPSRWTSLGKAPL
ncbi:uncharacterized protein LOC121745925 [Salvia splendens]|uniref:uncharacterized protein LOC121745925 n=1 Tax=Salvia splendens TaxID=180675 RepID=UPI001C271455|nr:uncharacterized protein LOC121745925 [Salvia splendens]